MYTVNIIHRETGTKSKHEHAAVFKHGIRNSDGDKHTESLAEDVLAV
jgi:hypothetical protein